MKFLFHGDMSHPVSCAILDDGGDVFEHPHAGSKLVRVRRKHANTAY